MPQLHTTDGNCTIFALQLHPICLIPAHPSSHVSLICHNIPTNQFTLLLSGDIETNPGPITGSLHHATRSSTKKFLLFSVNIRSLLNPKNSITQVTLPPALVHLILLPSKKLGYPLHLLTPISLTAYLVATPCKVFLVPPPPQSQQTSVVVAQPSWFVNQLSSSIPLLKLFDLLTALPQHSDLPQTY